MYCTGVNIIYKINLHHWQEEREKEQGNVFNRKEGGKWKVQQDGEREQKEAGGCFMTLSLDFTCKVVNYCSNQICFWSPALESGCTISNMYVVYSSSYLSVCNVWAPLHIFYCCLRERLERWLNTHKLSIQNKIWNFSVCFCVKAASKSMITFSWLQRCRCKC